MVKLKNLFSLTAIKWKMKQQYSIFRCFLGGGFYIYELDKNTKFVSYSKDALSHVFYVCNGHEKIELNWCEQWLKFKNENQVVIDCGAEVLNVKKSLIKIAQNMLNFGRRIKIF